MSSQPTLNKFSWMGRRFSGLFQPAVTNDQPPELRAPRRFPYGQFQVEISKVAGRQYQLEVSRDLRHWSVLHSDSPRGDSVEYLDTTATNFGYRYYRVRCGCLFSSKVVGFATLSIPPGFAMIANPLLGCSNTVASLLPNLPEGSTLTKFDVHLFKLTKNEFTASKWSNPEETLLPGEGAIISNPSSYFKTVSVVGEVQQGDLSLPIPAGFSIRSSIVPLPGQLDNDLMFPTAADDVIHLYDRDQQAYLAFSFKNGKWDPEPPLIGVGESFWVGKTFAGNWSRTLVLNQPEPEEVCAVGV